MNEFCEGTDCLKAVLISGFMSLQMTVVSGLGEQ